MIRKIQQIGNTFYISLPKEWIAKLNINKGDEISLIIKENGEITICPAKESKEEKIADIEYDKKNISRKIISYYLLGYDTIKIYSKTGLTNHEIEEILEIAKKLSGIEVVEESRNLIVLQTIVNESSIDPIKLLFRINSIASVLYVDALKSYNDVNYLNRLLEREVEIDRLYFLFVRQIRSLITKPVLMNKQNLTMINCMDLRLVGEILEKIGDETARLISELIKVNGKVKSEEISILYNYAIEIQKLQEKALVNFLKNKGLHNEEIKKEIQGLIAKMKETIKEEENITKAFENIANLIIDVCDLTSDI